MTVKIKSNIPSLFKFTKRFQNYVLLDVLTFRDNHKQRWNLIEDYIKKELEINRSLFEICKQIVKTSKIEVEDGEYVVSTDDLKLIHQYRLGSIVSILEDGNLDLRDSHLISHAFKFAKDTLEGDRLWA